MKDYKQHIMKTPLLHTLLLVTTFFSFAEAATSSKIKPPAELILPSYKQLYDSTQVVSIMKFYPVGWSKKGRFAYIRSQYNDASDSYTVDFTIQNLKNDRIEVLIFDEFIPQEKTVIETFWYNHIDTISNLLKAYSIQPVSDKIQQFPMPHSDSSLTIFIKQKCDSSSEITPGYYQGDTINIVARNNSGAKTIAHFNKQYLCNSISVAGYIRNPFEPVIAVILAIWKPGWEGPPAQLEIKVLGCNTIVNFLPAKD